MKKLSISLLGAICAILCLSFTSCTNKCCDKKNSDYYVAAFIWPSCHDDSLGHANLWADGEGEWEVIKKGNPRFEGHYQPKQPLWGYEHDDDPRVVERWIDTALKYGVNTFIYDWYWYMDYPYLEGALNDGFLKARNNEKMNFYIMWANHNVIKNYWNYHRYGDDTSLLFDASVNWEQFKTIVDRVINQYFKRPNYVKIDGCPVFSIFDMRQFLQSFGSLGEAAKAMDYFRDEVVKAGFKGLHLQESAGGGGFLSEEEAAYKREYIEKLGLNSMAFYNMGGFDCDYLKHGKNAIEIRQQYDEALDIPIFPTVSIGWDDTPRYPWKGANDVTRFNHSPQEFATFLQAAKEYADAHPDQPPFIMINAWNEWVEGSYLLPDRKYGFGWLEAVKDVIIDGKYDTHKRP
ncbi:MAG: glycoside hydrolase family 99-like domain-containing protein [Alistipes sp.]|nr:glycoside hydrolase family 99-like domain-containing protein [Alistipes sp.]